MNRLKNYDCITYDTNIILYYCFKTKETQVVELTAKTHRLTEFLINQKITINIPNFIANEFKKLDIARIIEDMISSNELTNMPIDTGYFLKMKLELKIKHKFDQLQQKDWFIIEDYTPSDESLNEIQDFFKCLNTHPKIAEFLKLKNKDSPIPSLEDMGLLTFSKENKYPIITNDYDLSFFRKELIKNKLSYEIYNLKELDFYNN